MKTSVGIRAAIRATVNGGTDVYHGHVRDLLEDLETLRAALLNVRILVWADKRTEAVREIDAVLNESV